MSKRRQNFQTISWFRDIYNRDLLDLDPKYQRRSVWSQEFKDYFIDTILLGYPSPAIFLYEEVDPKGVSSYSVVDGKQRLTTIFEFVNDKFPVSDKAERLNLQKKYFSQFDDTDKVDLWNYQFSVEYIPTKEENIINSIFNRINRNVSKLTGQELRHARFDGPFIASSEELAEVFGGVLPPNFPRFNKKSMRQMKDVEFTAQLLLLLEIGPRNYSADELDSAFAERDVNWDRKFEIETLFRRVIDTVKSIIDIDPNLTKTRLHNQADFYSLCGVIGSLIHEDRLPPVQDIVHRLMGFINIVEDSNLRSGSALAGEYYEAATGASTDTAKRVRRIEIIKFIIIGN